jgi:hypothetical protein
MLLRGYAANGHVGAFVIVDVHPARGMLLYLAYALPLVLAQPLVAHGSVESFNIGILLGLARLNVLQLDTPVLSPALDALADVLGPVVAANRIGFASPLDDVLQASDHALTG